MLNYKIAVRFARVNANTRCTGGESHHYLYCLSNNRPKSRLHKKNQIFTVKSYCNKTFVGFFFLLLPIYVAVRFGAVAGYRDFNNHPLGRVVQQSGHVFALPFVRKHSAHVPCNTTMGQGQINPNITRR